MIITSSTNDKYKFALSVKARKEPYCIAEGVRLLNDLPDTARAACYYYGEGFDLSKVKFKDGAGVYGLSDRLFDRLSDTVTPQGVLAVLELPAPKPLSDGNILVLDGLRDPGNVGTLMRTAAACGINDIVLKDSSDAFLPKVIRASMGTVFKLNIIPYAKGLLDGRNILILDMEGESLFDYGKLSNFALVVGSEAEGVSEELKAYPHTVLSLPMANAVESLNAAVAGSVAMYTMRNAQCAMKDNLNGCNCHS
jgi:TrmH family RNA methyltransferase